MNKLFVLITLLICGAAIVVGNLHWQNKISAQGESTDANKKVEQIEEKKQVVEEEKAVVNADVAALASNLPEALQAKIKNSADGGEPLQFVIYGSDSTPLDKGAWPELLTKQLNAAYGENIFNVTVISEGTKTTREVVDSQSYEEVSKLNPDLILFEPFMLKDNNAVVGISNTLDNVEEILEHWKSANEAVAILMQPPNPLYNANHYPVQIGQLKDYAEQNDIIYVNHWDSWPEQDDETMNDYLQKTGDQPSIPNESGHKVWSEYLIEYFVAE